MKLQVYSLGAKIRSAREAAGLSQADLAKKLHYKSASTIARIESGKNDLNQTKIASFASALGVPVGYLMDTPSNTTADTANIVAILRRLQATVNTAIDTAIAEMSALEEESFTPEEEAAYEKVRRIKNRRVEKESLKSEAV